MYQFSGKYQDQKFERNRDSKCHTMIQCTSQTSNSLNDVSYLLKQYVSLEAE